MNEQLMDSAEVRLHSQMPTAELNLPDIERIVDIAVEFNKLFILRGDDIGHAFRSFLLEELIRVTGSEFGYIAEVLQDVEGSPFLKVFGYALTDISWDDKTRELYQEHLESGLEFHNLGTIWGEGVLTASPVISNSLSDPRRSGTPAGHPAMDSFIGLPLMVNGELRGQVGLANRAGGYEEDWPELLRPVLDACGTAMVVARARMDQRRHTENLRISRDMLARQHEEAVELLRVRDTFISSVVHELRTPMAAMVVYARLLQEESESVASREYVEALNRNADRLAALLENVVLAATSAGKSVMLSKSTTDLVSLVQRVMLDCFAAHGASVASKQAPPKLSIKGEGPWAASVDSLRISQALSNVISNAMKYAPESPIVIELSSGEEGVAIKIQDFGPGMSAEDLERSVMPFFRGADALKRTTGGTGLGLSIAEKMVVAHGGKMLIDSSLGEGTTVTLVIPR